MHIVSQFIANTQKDEKHNKKYNLHLNKLLFISTEDGLKESKHHTYSH